jgi:hypothetical protein
VTGRRIQAAGGATHTRVRDRSRAAGKRGSAARRRVVLDPAHGPVLHPRGDHPAGRASRLDGPQLDVSPGGFAAGGVFVPLGDLVDLFVGDHPARVDSPLAESGETGSGGMGVASTGGVSSGLARGVAVSELVVSEFREADATIPAPAVAAASPRPASTAFPDRPALPLSPREASASSRSGAPLGLRSLVGDHCC